MKIPPRPAKNQQGNTEGRLVNEPKPNKPGGNSNPHESRLAPTPAEFLWGLFGDIVHAGLDAAAAIPVVGAAFDGLNGAIYAAEGDVENAALSFTSAALGVVPGVGSVAKGIKAATSAGRAGLKAGARSRPNQTNKTQGKGKKQDDGIAVKDNDKKSAQSKSCPRSGHPVNPILGIKFLTDETELDFVLPSVLPLFWQRSYFSDQTGNGWLGQGWSLPFSMRLLRQDDGMLLIDHQGREIQLPQPEAGQSRFHRYEQIFFTRETNNRYCVNKIASPLRYIFAPLTLGHDDPQGAKAHYLPLVAIEDAYGNHIRLCYNDAELPADIYDAAGRRLGLHFITLHLADGSQAHRLHRVVQFPEQTVSEASHHAHQGETLVTYRYSAQGDLISVVDGKGQVRREYCYINHMLTGHSQPGGIIARYEYDEYSPKGKVIRHTTNLGQTWLFDYREGETWVTDPLQRITRYQFNADKEFTGVIDASGQASRATLDSHGRPVSFTLPGGLQTHYIRDSFGKVTSITDAAGNRTAIRYDSRHRPVAVTDALGNTTNYLYDYEDNYVSVVNALGHITQYHYDNRGLLTAITDSDGKSRYMEYDPAGLIIALTDCSGLTTRLSRDAKGNVKNITYPDGTQTAFTYDDQGKLLAAFFADGSGEHFTWDQLGRQTARRDALGAETTWQFDVDGLPLKRIDAYGQRFHYQYDAARRLVCLTNENGASHRIIYDKNDNILCEQGFDGAVTRYRYDDAGQLIEKDEFGTRTDASSSPGIRTLFRRDLSGRVTEKIIQDRVHNILAQSQYHYDAAGRLIRAQNTHAIIERSYDKLGQLVSETCEAMGQRQTLQHSYGSGGQRNQTLLPDGTQLNYFCYGPEHLLQINIDQQILCEIERDIMHREISRTQGALTSRFHYSATGQLLNQQTFADTPCADFIPPVISRRYQYDKTGNLQTMIDLHGKKRDYRYDLLGRLIQCGEEHFAFDPAHNLTEQRVLKEGGKMNNNRPEHYLNHRYVWDRFGNLSEKITDDQIHLRLHYTPEHQVARVETEGNGRRQITEYGYDALGRRVYKKGPDGNVLFLWDEDRLLSENSAGQTITWLYEPGSFIPLAQMVQKDQTEKKIYYYHTDQIGTPHELTSEQGQIVWQARYKAWGRIAQQRQKDGETLCQPLRFQGQYHDEESGLHYNRYRYYDPDIGRFITPDPIGLAGGENGYQYAPNPTGWIDPLGLMNQPGGSTPSTTASGFSYGNIGKSTYSFDRATKNLNIQGHGAPFVTQTDRLASGSSLSRQVKDVINKEGGQVNRVSLQSCYSANGGSASQAQQLANAINRPVTGYKGLFSLENRAGSSRPLDGSGGRTKTFQPSTSNVGRAVSSAVNRTGNAVMKGYIGVNPRPPGGRH